MAHQCRAGFLFAVAGDFLRSRANCSLLLSRRALHPYGSDSGLHARDYRGKSSRARHHVWLFWSCQPALELPCTPGDESRNYRCAGGALGLESFDQVFAGQALCLGLLIRQPRNLSGLLFNSTRSVRFICEYSIEMIRKLKSGKYRLYSRKKNPKTGRRRNLGTFTTKSQAKKHEQAIQYFKRR